MVLSVPCLVDLRARMRKMLRKIGLNVMSCGHVDGIRKSCGWEDDRSSGSDKEISHGFLPKEKLVLSDK